MVFSSTVFLFLFFPALLLIYYCPVVKNNISLQNIVLLIFSLFFYAWGEPLFVFLMILSILINYGMVILMEKSENKKIFMIICIVINVFVLFVFKYSTFIIHNIFSIIGKNTDYNVALPIGISFFTFQMMSYVWDVYYGKVKAQKNLFRLSLYIILFPQLIAGPIVRYNSIERQLENRKHNIIIISEGIRRFVYGLGKKVLIANFMAQIADNIFAYSMFRSVGLAWLGAVAYTLQIYYDFSGYSDMAIGLGKIFGFEFFENFNYPYIASNITDFWRRWHISLSTWFKDYVYIPLGGNKCSKRRHFINLLIVWMLTGIWHGANWTFIIWGSLYFILLVFEKYFALDKKNNILTHIYTMFFVVIAWVIFRSNTISDAINYIGQMFNINAYGISFGFFVTIKRVYIVLLISILGTTPIFKKIMESGINKNKVLENLWLIFVFSLSLFEIVKGSYNPFIYFNF